uniref:Uncharacterized protein n=1 Tax=Rhodopseudomonas palustris (strain BisA53) TaxID=316055 RepID=Q07T59_RHOP5
MWRCISAREVTMAYALKARFWIRVVLAGVVLALLGQTARAAEWTTHSLAEVSFAVPADWTVSQRRKDRALLLRNPAGNLELRVEWWLQDEPLLGFADIKSHKRVKVAGKPATWVHSGFADTTVLKIVLDEKRRDRHQLLLVLEATGTEFESVAPLFDEILARVNFGNSAAIDPGRQIVTSASSANGRDGARYLPSADEEEVRLWLGPVSFEAPVAWQVRPDPSGVAIAMVRPDQQAELVVTLWQVGRPMPSDGVETVEHVTIAGEPATRLRQRTRKSEVEHIFFDDPLPDGARIAITLRPAADFDADAAPILELFYASLDRHMAAPGGPTLMPWHKRGPVGDPFADLDMKKLLK